MTNAPKNKPPARRGGPAKALSVLTERMTRPLFKKRGFADVSLLTDWPRIAGEAIARHSVPEKIGFPPGKRRHGTLHLIVAPGGFAVELKHLEPQLIERVNGYFGYAAIERVHMVQAPLPAPPHDAPPEPQLTQDEQNAVSQQLSDVTDDELRRHLEALGQGVQRRGKARNG